MMNNPMPRMYTYASAITTLAFEHDNEPDKLFNEKLAALKKVYATVERYAKDGFIDQIVDTIMEKKAKMILDATSIKDVRELSDPPKPKYDGNKWHSSKNSVPEEEMVWWSKTSFEVTLTYEAVKRYEELFKQFFGADVYEIMNRGLYDDQK